MVTRMTPQTRAVLEALMKNPQDELYGLQIAEMTDLAAGTTYTILLRLQNDGWVEARWENVDPEEVGRPARRYYRITSDGAAQASSALTKSRRKRGRAAASPLPEGR